MGNFINYNSFLITALLLEAFAIYYFVRSGLNGPNMLRLSIVTVLIVVAFLGIRPAETTSEAAADLEARLGNGVPALMEFKSPN